MTHLQKVANCVIERFGKNISLYSVNSVATDNYGQDTVTWNPPSTIKAVFDRPTEEDLRKLKQGEVIVGRKFYLIKHDTTVDVGDKVVDDSIEYQVDLIEINQFYDADSVKRIRVHRVDD